MLTDKEMYRRMEKGWRGGRRDGTVCGQGSTLASAGRVMKWLPMTCQKYGIAVLNDAGAGDMHWISRVEWFGDIEYVPYDLIPRRRFINKLDITTQTMAPADAILCRFVLNHLVDDDCNQRVTMALDRFKESAPYLFATNFQNGKNRKRQFIRLDLREYLGEPIESVRDGHEDNCYLSLWRF